MTKPEAEAELELILDSLIVQGQTEYSIVEVTPGDFRIKTEDVLDD